MTKLALICDTHFGARGDSPAFANYFRLFYQNVFFPYIDKHQIKNIIHLGDIVDRRKFINFVSAKNLRDDLVRPAHERGIISDFIIGNHDATFKNTNSVNSMQELYSDSNYNIRIHADPTEVGPEQGYPEPILFIPWINDENAEQSFKMIENSRAQLLFGHLELQGFEMHKGVTNAEGMDPSMFNKFDLVCSGHFHHKSSGGNIHYLGAPYEITWADYKDPRGFHVFDTETRELTYIENPYRMFHKVWYDDLNKTLEEVMHESVDHLKGTYVKVVVSNKTNPFWFDMFIDRLEKVGTADISIAEDHLNLHSEDDTQISDVEDTVTMINNYVQKMALDDADKKALDLLFRELYNESLNLETT